MIGWFGSALPAVGMITMLGVVVLVSITIWATKITAVSSYERNLATFDALTVDNGYAMRSRLQSYRQSLDGGAALFEASDEVTLPEWRSYVHILQIEDTLPGINGIGMIEAVAETEVDQFLNSARLRGVEGLQIHPATGRDEFLPITYIEPIEPNREAVGLDISFESNRRNAAYHARDSGRSTITKRIDLVQDKTKSAGFLLLRPTYERGRSLRSIEDRRAAFRGWIYAPFIASRFMQGLTTSQGKSLEIEVYDGSEAVAENLIFSNRKSDSAKGKALYSITRTFPMMEQQWTIVWNSTPQFEASVSNREPFLIMGGGIALTAAFIILMYFYARREAYVTNEVSIKTEELVSKEKELSAALVQAKSATEAKSKFLANMSHETRTPMNGVIGFTQLLDDGKLNARQKRYVQMISESGAAMMSLLNDILDISKVDAGLMTMENDSIDVRSILQNCIRLVSPTAEAKGLELVLEFAPDLPVRVKGDGLRLRQIVLNLLANAVKFTNIGGVILEAAYHPTKEAWQSLRGQSMLSIRVTDTGIGIRPDRQATIFEPFKQEDDSTARKYGGTGLGLSISNKLVKLMGGTIALHSRLGEGSKFTITIPAENCSFDEPVDPDSEISRTDTEICVADRAAIKARILVAEDHDVNQMLVEEMLTRLGFEIELANDGAEAIAKVRRAKSAGQPFDLVLMDIQMPNIDGLRATEKIREGGIAATELPIIALTANAYAQDIQRCMEVGMQAHLAKPFSVSALQRILACWLPERLSADSAANPKLHPQS